MELRQRRTQHGVNKPPLIHDIPDGSGYSTEESEPNKLGFRHWLAILTMIAGIYAFVVYQDNVMPEVKPDGQFEEFSEVRARRLLNELTGLGPRPSGSENCEVHAVNIISVRLQRLAEEVKIRDVNRMELDVQRPSGCYNLKFLSAFTLCYHKITNLIARIGPKTPAKHAILVNCHFDTLPDAVGATDDAVSCALMMEILEILAHSTESLANDIVFLFNGAEENFLQASHGFVTQHPWRHSLRAFINLEGSGAGGREILFQAGPGNSWLLHTYLQKAPHPHCSVLAQEIFQAGLIPSDTDYRIFRDYGRIPGLDIAYFRNGWVYHTEFDLPKYIAKGCIQRAGENVLAVLKALISSPYLDRPGDFEQSNRWVFYDVVGLFTVIYSVKKGVTLNFTIATVIGSLIAYRMNKKVYSMYDMLTAFVHHGLAACGMLAVGGLIALIVIQLDLVMCWYSFPELVFPLYIIPMLFVGCFIHSIIAERSGRRNVELVHFDSVLLIYSMMLIWSTAMGYASAFFLLIHVFPLMRDPLTYLLQRMRILNRVRPLCILCSQVVCAVPVMIFDAYAAMLLFDFFVPVAGRLGKAVNPEFLMMLISFFVALSFILHTNNLVYISRRLDYLMKCGFFLYLVFFSCLVFTRLGWPYKYSEDAPRLRRLILLDTKRSTYPFNSNISYEEHALFVQAFDYRGVDDLPEHTFLSGDKRPSCDHVEDEYCRLPYYTAIHQLFPPREAKWVPLPGVPSVAKPVKLVMTQKTLSAGNVVTMEFIITGGTDKMSLHLTPINGFVLSNWSFTDFHPEMFGARRTFFVFLAHGAEAPQQSTFSVVLTHKNELAGDIINGPAFEISIAAHYVHGSHQYSQTLLQLKSLIALRRATPHVALGWWKWAITAISGVSEIIVHTF